MNCLGQVNVNVVDNEHQNEAGRINIPYTLCKKYRDHIFFKRNDKCGKLFYCFCYEKEELHSSNTEALGYD